MLLPPTTVLLRTTLCVRRRARRTRRQPQKKNCPFSSRPLLPLFLLLLFLPALLPSPLLTLPFQMSASQRDMSHRVACESVCVWQRQTETEEDHIKDFLLPFTPKCPPTPSRSLMWPALISGADIAAVPSPLVEKTLFPLRRMLLNAQRKHNAHTRTHTGTLEHL